MNIKHLVIIIIIVIVVIAGGYSLYRANAPQGAPSMEANSSTTPPVGSPSAATYTLTEVGEHNSAASCWAAVNGKVYDLTRWISQHPGGPERILSLCGTDGSAAFNAQHDVQPNPNAAIASFFIGTLEN